jgi:hypothetical protein
MVTRTAPPYHSPSQRARLSRKYAYPTSDLYHLVVWSHGDPEGVQVRFTGGVPPRERAFNLVPELLRSSLPHRPIAGLAGESGIGLVVLDDQMLWYAVIGDQLQVLRAGYGELRNHLRRSI